MTTLPIAIVDPNRLFREGLANLLAEEGFHVVLSVGTANEITPAAVPAADIVLFDARDALGDKIAALRSLFPAARIVLLTDTIDHRGLGDALRGGVDGCLLKDTSHQALAQSLRLVLIGEKVFPSSLAVLLLSGQAGGTQVGPSIGQKGLSQREVQILRALVEGFSNKMIANRLNITEATVKVHLKSLLRKINAANRTQAAIWAMNNGMATAGNAQAA